MKILKLLIIILLISLASCQDKNSDTVNVPEGSNINEDITINHSNIIATYNGGNISKSELSDYLLTSSSTLQWNQQDTIQWASEIIIKLATEKQLISEATDLGIQNRVLFNYEKHSLERYLFTQQYFSKLNEHFSNNNQDLLNYYNENINDYIIEEERLVFHIFKSKTNNNSSKAFDEISALKRRINNGENFKLLAENHSDSESRHLQGLIGKIKKGVMTPDFDKVVFSLVSNETSEIVNTPNGYHIFFVDNILKAKSFEFSEVKNLVQQKLLRKIKTDYLRSKAEELGELDKYKIPNSESELSEQIENNDLSYSVVEIDDFKLNVTEIKYSLNELKKATPSTKVREIAYSWLLETAYREIIFQHMIDNNIEYDQPKLLEYQISKLLIKEFSKTKINEYINKHPELINDFYQKNTNRFSTPIKFSFEKLTIPKSTNINLMQELEASIQSLNNGELSINNLAKKYNGTITEIKLKNYNQLSDDDYHISSFASQLELNQHSYPYTTRTDYHIVKLTERIDPKVQPLLLIRDKVLKKYVDLHDSEVFSKVLSDLSKSIKINEKNLEVFLNDYKKFI